jgi:hypothetical protein
MTLPGDALRLDELDGQLGGSSRSLAITINAMRLAGVPETTADTHLYANGSTGSDEDNDGLSVGSPKRSLQAVFDLIPLVVKHVVIVHLSGTFAETGNVYLAKMLTTGAARLLVDGGGDLTELVAGVTSDINSVSSIGLSTAGYTADEHAGLWVEILTGPATGNIRLISENTTTTLSPQKDFSVDPGAGAQYRIVRPTTNMKCDLKISSLGQAIDLAEITMQNFTLLDAGSLSVVASTGGVRFSTCVLETDNSTAVSVSRSQGFASFDNAPYSAVDASVLSGPRFAGPSVRGSDGELRIIGCYGSQVRGVFCRNLRLFYTNCQINQGTRVRGALEIVSPQTPFNFLLPDIADTAGYYTTTVDEASGNGVSVLGGNIYIGNGVRIRNNGGHGIVADACRMKLGTAAGSGNTDHGLRAENGANVVTDGTPTLTGTNGDVETESTTTAWGALPVVATTTDLAKVA